MIVCFRSEQKQTNPPKVGKTRHSQSAPKVPHSKNTRGFGYLNTSVLPLVFGALGMP